MTSDKTDFKELFNSLGEISTRFLELISSAKSTTLNNVPFAGSWTAAQVASHVTKSNKAIEQALHIEGKLSERNPGERVEELKKMFLNYSAKFQSPQFIIPTQDIYQKEILVADLKNSMEKLKETGEQSTLSEIISLPAFGEITKFELLHFVLYHTQRHLHQLKNIFKVLKTKN
ncbi:MAG: DinB family protein [Bacteroidota bacterium]|nr:DinB family protein [Bacteroidota bacterium]MDQ6890709.1 DinB family protein [Bacteroidota bacterium]